MKEFEGNYIQFIDQALRPGDGKRGVVLDLFAGCGGLGLGFEAAGFETIGFEMDGDCCATYNLNLNGTCHQIFLTPKYLFPDADVVIGGPPCQPFSVGGNQLGLKDSRDGFPSFISAVEQVNPKLWMFENVRGLLYRNRWYMDEIVSRLERLGYVVEFHLLNASHYHVPQNRERVIVVGHKGLFSFPKHAGAIVTAGQALGDMAKSTPDDAKYLSSSQDEYVKKYELASKCINPRDLALDRIARTLTCRNLAGATGDMQRIKLNDGRRRRLLVREAARLQSFPDWFEFTGGQQSQYNQIGNAVAPMFAYALAESISAYLDSGTVLSKDEIMQRYTPTQASLPY
jgi:DNA (cytosine-5)-methyltransferase 1